MRTGVLVVLAMACGCGRPKRDDKATKPAPVPAEKAPVRKVELPEPEIVLPRELAFELLDAGAEKRAVLRWALAAGHATLVTKTTLSTRELVDGTWHEPTASPATTTKLDIVAAEGGKLTLDGSSVVTVDDRGRLVDHGSSSDELIQRLLIAFMPMPKEQIGDGARWRVVTAFRQQGAVVKQTATYTLQHAMTVGMPIEIGVDIQELAEHQQVGNAEIVAISRELHGTYTLGMISPFPSRCSLTVKSTVHVRIDGHEHIVEDTGTAELTTQVSSTAK